MNKQIQEFTKNYRATLEPHWTPDLLYEKFKAKPGDAVSAGFCGPSSVLLWQALQQEFPNEIFSLAVGKVYKNSIEWIRGKHVWVVWHHALKGATIIDITADQSNDYNEKILCRDIDEIAQAGINYLPYQLARTLDEVDASPKARSERLRTRLES